MKQLEIKEISTEAKVGWGQLRRLQFIDFRLRWEGKINRTDLENYFGISTPQASLDIARYMELAPLNTHYDKSSKTYPSSEKFEPVYPRSSARRYLAELLATELGIIEKNGSFIGASPELDWAVFPERSVDDETVEMVVKAIREKRTIEVCYHSIRSPEPMVRVLSPHALANDGFRWHVRAYCHKQNRFADFLFARILSITLDETSAVSAANDFIWQTFLSLEITPHPDLSLASQKVVEKDYGMQNGQIELQCRHAMLFYTLRRLGLHRPDSSDPVSQQICLKNREELQPYIDIVNPKAS